MGPGNSNEVRQEGFEVAGTVLSSCMLEALGISSRSVMLE